MQTYRERWRENFAQYRNGMVPEQMSTDTKNYLRKIGLWEKESAWTNQAMRDLALSRDEHGQTVLAFEQVTFAVRTFASNRLILLMNEYVLALQTTEHIRDAFEYAVQYRQIDLLEELTKWGEERDSLKEWGLVYQLLLDVLKERITHEETIDQARDLVGSVTDPLLKVRLELLEVFSYLKLGYYMKAAYLDEKVSKKLAQVKESFAKRVVESWVEFQIAYHLLYNRGKSEEAERHVVQSVINGATPETMLAYCYHLLAYAAFTMPASRKHLSIEPSIHHIQQSLYYAERTGLQGYRDCLQTRDLPFLLNANGKIFELEKNIDPEEQVHQYVIRGEREKALFLAKELEQSGQNSALLTFYQAKAARDLDHLCGMLLETSQEDHVFLLPMVKREMLHIHRIKDDELKRVQMQFRTFKWKVTLSPREIEVLELIYEGNTQLEIANELYLSTSTVKKHVNSVLKKTGLQSSKEAASVAKKLLLF
ncbi:AimR family lysis-lysogeny pheromone receptor [Bacillus sp. FSL W7-1360]